MSPEPHVFNRRQDEHPFYMLVDSLVDPDKYDQVKGEACRQLQDKSFG